MKGGIIVKGRATYNKEFAARLKRYMDRAGLRAVDLSRATGIMGQADSYWNCVVTVNQQ